MNPRTDTEGESDRSFGRRFGGSWLRSLLVASVFLDVIPATASAHVPSAGASVGFRFPVLVGGSALVGSAGGFAVVAYRSRRVADWLTDRRFVGVVGIGLSGLAGSVLLSILGSRPLLVGASVLVGVLGAAVLSSHENDHLGSLEIASATGALTLHQFVEGALLAGAYVAGGVVGVAAALFLTLHTVAETATVAGAYATVGRRKRGAAAVVFMQTVYVVAAGLAFVAAWSVPALAGDVVAAVVAGVLLAVGLHESWCALCEPVVGFPSRSRSETDAASGIENRDR